MNNYIQNKLDELIETYRKENYSEYDVRMVAERLATHHHNHIVENIKKNYSDENKESDFSLEGILSIIQDTNK